MRNKIKSINYITLMLCLSISFCSCRADTKNVSLKEPKVETAETTLDKYCDVKIGSISNMLPCNGTFLSDKAENLSFKCKSGYFKGYKASVGQQVKKGELLAELDTEEINDKIKIQELVVKKFKIKYDDIIARKEDESLINLAEIELAEENFKLSLLKEELTGCRITAPFDGKIAAISGINEGQKIFNQSVLTIADTKELYMRCTAENLNKCKVGMKVYFAKNGKDYTGEIAAVSYGGDNNNQGSEINPPNAPGEIRGGNGYAIVKLNNSPTAAVNETITASIQLNEKKDVLVIPKSFLIIKNGFTYVMFNENNVTEEKIIEVGLENDTMIEVTAGLKEGDMVVSLEGSEAKK